MLQTKIHCGPVLRSELLFVFVVHVSKLRLSRLPHGSGFKLISLFFPGVFGGGGHQGLPTQPSMGLCRYYYMFPTSTIIRLTIITLIVPDDLIYI